MYSNLAIGGVVVLFFTGFFGPGGSLYYRPLSQVMLGFGLSHAAGAAQVLISGASIATACYHWAWQHCHPEEPVRILGLYLMLILPANLAGDIAGAYLADLVPELFQLIVLAALCACASLILFRRAVKTAEAEQSGSQIAMFKPHLEISHFKLLIYYAVIFITYALFIFIRGNSYLKSIAGIKMCSGIYWIVTAAEFVALFVTAWLNCPQRDRFLIGIALVEGALVNMVGIPVGSIMKPVLITFTSVAPVQASATTSMLVACISTSKALGYLISGSTPLDTLIFSIFTFTGCLVGLTSIHFYLVDQVRRSLLQYFMTLIFSLGGCFIFAVDMMNYVNGIATGVISSQLVC